VLALGRLVVVAGLAAAAPPADIPVVALDGVVHAVSADYVVRAIESADGAAAPLIVIRIDTPGGLDPAMRQIVDAVLNCRTPVAAFVAPPGARAASAGFVIALAADVVAMAPGTNLGAAHPVSALGQMDETMAKKVAQDAAAYVRSKAQRRGRNPGLAEAAVLESRSFTETEALEAGLVDVVAPDVPALLAALDGREVKRFDGRVERLALAGHAPREVPMSGRQRILSRPDVLFLLLLGALAGIGAEISHPGLVFPGVLGLVCLVLFLFAGQIVPIAWAGLLLILLAIGLFAAEVKVTSYGLLTVGGVISMVLGAMMLVDSDLPALRPSPWTLWPAVLAMAVFTSLLLRLVLRAQRRRPTTGSAGMLGQPGVALASFGADGEGWVEVQGERWRATGAAAIAPGDRIRVEGVEGLTLRVRKEER